jgi:hypothetical protein
MEFRDPNDQARYETLARLKRAAFALGKRSMDVEELNQLLPLPAVKAVTRRQYVRRFGFKPKSEEQ